MRVLDFAAPVEYEESLRPGARIPIYGPRRADVEVINRLAAFLAGQPGAVSPTDAEVLAVVDYVLREATADERASLDMAQCAMILLASVGQVREIEALLTDWRARAGDGSDPPTATPAADPASPTLPPMTTPSA